MVGLLFNGGIYININKGIIYIVINFFVNISDSFNIYNRHKIFIIGLNTRNYNDNIN